MLVEVSPRDGLQNEPTHLSTGRKVELVRRCIAAGATRIEAVSFVHPGRVPQMADAEGVMDAVPRPDGVRYAGLALNERGLHRAIDAGVDEVNYVVVATDTFGRRNQGRTTEEALRLWEDLLPQARRAGLWTTVTIAAAFGCPFEGEVDPAGVIDIARRVDRIGVNEIALADTIGVGTPDVVTHLLQALAADVRAQLRCHFHNTRNTGMANVAAAVAAVPDVALDTSLGGIGGCPFAPNATGNVPTEDVAWMLGRMGRATGLDVSSAIADVGWLDEQLGSRSPGLLSRAGTFPPPRRAGEASGRRSVDAHG